MGEVGWGMPPSNTCRTYCTNHYNKPNAFQKKTSQEPHAEGVNGRYVEVIGMQTNCETASAMKLRIKVDTERLMSDIREQVANLIRDDATSAFIDISKYITLHESE